MVMPHRRTNKHEVVVGEEMTSTTSLALTAHESGAEPEVPEALPTLRYAMGTGELLMIQVGAIRPARGQARKYFDTEALQGLADSMRQDGLHQPITVRPNGDGTYELVMGERRLRAAKVAGMNCIPAIVRSIDDGKATLAGLVENIQRANLSPLELGEAFDALLLSGYTFRRLASELGVPKSFVEDRVRVARAPEDVRELVVRRPDTLTHARDIAPCEDPERRKRAISAAESGASLKSVRELLRPQPSEALPSTQDKDKQETSDSSGSDESVETDDSAVAEPQNEHVATRTEAVMVTKMVVSGCPATEDTADIADPQEQESDSMVQAPCSIEREKNVASPIDEPASEDDEEAASLVSTSLIEAARHFSSILKTAIVPSDSDELGELHRELTITRTHFMQFWTRLLAANKERQ